MPITQTCEQCGTGFSIKPYQKDSKKYCGPACRRAAKIDRVTCKQCGKGFDWYKSQAKRTYCSLACEHSAKSVQTNCLNCGKVFVASKSTGQKCCSVACAFASAHPAVLIPCIECGTIFRVPPARKDTAKFCSRDCVNASPEFRELQKVKQQAEKSWRWSGGLYQVKEGYVRQRVVRSGKVKSSLQHRVLVAEWLAATDPSHPFLVPDALALRSEIEVHHVDRDRSNNAPDNLLAVTQEAHARIHHQGVKPEPGECWPNDPERW